MKNPPKPATPNELMLANVLFDVLVRVQQVQGIVGSITTHEDLDIDLYFRNALWGALTILQDAEKIIKITDPAYEA